jgi:hypothetical protein
MGIISLPPLALAHRRCTLLPSAWLLPTLAASAM